MRRRGRHFHHTIIDCTSTYIIYCIARSILNLMCEVSWGKWNINKHIILNKQKALEVVQKEYLCGKQLSAPHVLMIDTGPASVGASPFSASTQQSSLLHLVFFILFFFLRNAKTQWRGAHWRGRQSREVLEGDVSFHQLTRALCCGTCKGWGVWGGGGGVLGRWGPDHSHMCESRHNLGVGGGTTHICSTDL